VEGFGQGGLKVFEGAGDGLAQVRLEFGEGLLDGIEIGTLARQVAHLGPWAAINSPTRCILWVERLSRMAQALDLSGILATKTNDGLVRNTDSLLGEQFADGLIGGAFCPKPEDDWFE